MAGWYLEAAPPEDCEWLLPATRENIRASEDIFDLNIKPEDIFLPPEEIQAADQDWSFQAEPVNLWAITDEDTVPAPEEWYIDQEPEFYWKIELDPDNFYGPFSDIAEFYWLVFDEPLEVNFYPDPEPVDGWSEFYSPVEGFYIGLDPIPQSGWYIQPEPEPCL